jgi:hypothetical protein
VSEEYNESKFTTNFDYSAMPTQWYQYGTPREIWCWNQASRNCYATNVRTNYFATHKTLHLFLSERLRVIQVY